MRFLKPLAQTGLKQIRLPLFSMPVSAGSPKPADGYVEETLDLSRLLIRRPDATFFVRVEGESMVDAEIHPGDLLVVDRSIEPRHKDIVIAIIDGEFTVKVLHKKPDLRLVSRNADAPTKIEGAFEVWGVVLWVVHKAR